MVEGTEQMIVEALYNNLQSLYAKFLELQIELIESEGHAYQQTANMIKNTLDKADPKIRTLTADDKIRSYVYMFNYIYKFFSHYTKILFENYRKAPTRLNGTYASIYEVEEYCKKIEPKILKEN